MTEVQDLPQEVREAMGLGAGDELPPEVLEAMREEGGQLRAEQLAALGTTLASMRDKAVKARAESGIEATWMECEEAYLGIDDENRGEFEPMRWAKPMTMDGPLRRAVGANSSNEVRATAFVCLTSRYVDAGTAKVCEIAIPVDGKPFTLKATPVPELVSMKEDNRPAEEVTGQPMPGPDGEPVKVSTLAAHQLGKAEKAAEKAAKRIHDWMVEYKHNAEIRKCVFDMARLGVCVLKGPIPEERQRMAAQRQGNAMRLDIVREVKPAARWVDPWNFYPAPGCGEDIHNGDHAFESDTMLEHQLSKLLESGDENYIKDALRTVIEQGPDGHRDDAGNRLAKRHDSQYRVWYFSGWLKRADFMLLNPKQGQGIDEKRERVFVQAMLINASVVRAVLQPLDSGRLPYHVGNWRRRIGHWAGVGVGEQIRTPQRIANAATRALLTNAGKSSGAQVVMDPNAVEPANRQPGFTPDKTWYIRKDSGVDDVRKVFAAFNWPNTTDQLMKVIEYAFKLAEEHSSIPLITQGQSGKTTPDTFGGQQLQDSNANQLLRDVGFGLNDRVTTPLVDQLYEWLLLDPDVPEDEKGDWSVDTSGALALIEKTLNDQTILQIGTMLQNPAFRIDPAKWFEAYARTKRLTPAEFQYTDEEWKKVSSQPQPTPPQVQAAQIRAEAQVKVAESRDALMAEKIRVDTDRDTAYNESLANRDAAENDYRLRELQLRERLAILDYANKREMTLDQVKAELAQTTMKLQTQRALAGADGHGPQVATPADEPPGRAPDGTAYQR